MFHPKSLPSLWNFVFFPVPFFLFIIFVLFLINNNNNKNGEKNLSKTTTTESLEKTTTTTTNNNLSIDFSILFVCVLVWNLSNQRLSPDLNTDIQICLGFLFFFFLFVCACVCVGGLFKTFLFFIFVLIFDQVT